MTVTFVATLPPATPTIVGRALPLARALSARGHRVRVLTLGDHHAPSGVSSSSPVRVEVVGPSLRGGSPDRPPFTTILGRLRTGREHLATALRDTPSDVIVLVKPHPQNLRALATTSTPVILDADDDERWASRLRPLERWVMGRIEQRAARRASVVTVCSPALAARYTALGARRVELLPTGILPSSASAPNIRTSLGLPADTPFLLSLGSVSLSSGHRIDHLLDVWDALAADNPELRLIIAGDGIDLEAMRGKARTLRHGARVHFLGRFAAEEAEGYARQATLLVDPVDASPASEAKSSSRTMLALLTGTPVAAGNTSIHQFLLPASLHASLLYPPGNLPAFLAALRRSLTTETRERFQNETRGRWEQWSWDRLGARFAEIVAEVAR